ncbi:MAG TPA: hypothetical protein VF136_12950 [Methylomirabilota bacterium]
MTLVRLAIWVATAFFVAMLFSPLVQQMMVRLSASTSSGMP